MPKRLITEHNKNIKASPSVKTFSFLFPHDLFRTSSCQEHALFPPSRTPVRCKTNHLPMRTKVDPSTAGFYSNQPSVYSILPLVYVTEGKHPLHVTISYRGHTSCAGSKVNRSIRGKMEYFVILGAVMIYCLFYKDKQDGDIFIRLIHN